MMRWRLLVRLSERSAKKANEQEQEVIRDDRHSRFGSASLVEGANQGSVVRLDRGVARLDARCVRLHDLLVDYGADRADLWRVAGRGNRGIHVDVVGPGYLRHRQRLSRRPPLAPGA